MFTEELKLERARVRAGLQAYYRPNSRFYHNGVATCHACNEIAHLPDTGCMSCGSDNVTHHRVKARAKYRDTKTFRVRMEQILFSGGRETIKAYDSTAMKERKWTGSVSCGAGQDRVTIHRFIRTYEVA